MKNNYIICGIHTDCGKSVISVLLYEYLRDLTNQEPLLVKPIQTGPFPDTDFYQACHIEKQNIV
ncbi:dethiobiotin synthase, partial [Enterococcus gallinarum]|nr:dethiobiotin synthase [Enterococcus gallinarum]